MGKGSIPVVYRPRTSSGACPAPGDGTGELLPPATFNDTDIYCLQEWLVPRVRRRLLY